MPKGLVTCHCMHWIINIYGQTGVCYSKCNGELANMKNSDLTHEGSQQVSLTVHHSLSLEGSTRKIINEG